MIRFVKRGKMLTKILLIPIVMFVREFVMTISEWMS